MAKVKLGGVASGEDAFMAPMRNHARVKRILYWLKRETDKTEMLLLEKEAAAYFMRGYVLEIEALGGVLTRAGVPFNLIGVDTNKMKDARWELALRYRFKPSRDAAIRRRIRLFK